MAKFFEDIKLGDKYVTPARTIELADIINFAGLTGDWNPLHTNKEHAEKIFGGRIAHGLLTLSVISGLSARGGILSDTEENIIAFLGIKELKFLNPVMSGDTIHLEEEVVNKRETKKADRGVISINWLVKNQKDDKIMVGEANIMIKRK